jgi:hypothetical protein
MAKNFFLARRNPDFSGGQSCVPAAGLSAAGQRIEESFSAAFSRRA